MKDKEKQTLKFSVIDNKTGEYPDLYNIALKEDWAKDLMYCDMEGFSINEDGQLILSDECGKFVYCPSDRFTVVFEDSVVLNGSKLAKLVEEVRQEFENRYKDKVIIDKEEYNKVDDFFKMSLSAQIAYLRENKRLKEDVQALIGMRFERFNLITQEESDKKVEQSSKETAEKILKDVQKKITQLRLNGHLSREQDIRLSRFLVGKAQDYGIEVEIKE